MKKLLVLCFIAPLLMATQCEDDFNTDGSETSFVIQNDSGITLSFPLENGNFIAIENGSVFVVSSEFRDDSTPLLPSESPAFEEITLFQEQDGEAVQVYEQNPIDNALWVLDEPFERNFEYRLTITPDLIN